MMRNIWLTENSGLGHKFKLKEGTSHCQIYFKNDRFTWLFIKLYVKSAITLLSFILRVGLQNGDIRS